MLQERIIHLPFMKASRARGHRGRLSRISRALQSLPEDRLFKAVAVSLCFLCISSSLGQTSPATLPDLQLTGAGLIWAMAVQDDGKVIIGGQFDAVNGIPRTNIARINRDGSVDKTWGPNADRQVGALCLVGSNLYAGGLFTKIGGVTRISIAKLRTT